MYVLVCSKNYLNLKYEIEKRNNIGIVYFELNFVDEKEYFYNLEKILIERQTLNLNINVILINSQNINSNYISKINNLRKYFDLIIGIGGSNRLNRFYLEETRIDFLANPQDNEQKKIDFIHHFNSGLNQTLCKFAKKNNIGLLFTLNFDFFNIKNFRLFARINQNLKFAQKYNLLINFQYLISSLTQIKSKKEIIAISSLFKLSLKQQQEISNSLQLKITQNLEVKKDNFISKKIKLIKK